MDLLHMFMGALCPVSYTHLKNPRGMVITAGQGDGRLIMKGEVSAEESVS